MSDRIYTLTVLRAPQNHDKIRPWHGKPRTWCWFPTLAAAKAAVMRGDDYFFESGSYDMVVIEEVEGGFPPLGCPMWWFSVSYTEGSHYGTYTVTELADPPEWAHNVINFAMG
jgi:hypothetical protein